MKNISIWENSKTKELTIEFYQGVSKEEILKICKTLNKEQLQSLFDTQGFHDSISVIDFVEYMYVKKN